MFVNDTVSGRLERVKGIEPSSKAWEAAVLPVNYTRMPCGIVAAPPWRKPQRLEGKVRACAGLHLGAGLFWVCVCCA